MGIDSDLIRGHVDTIILKTLTDGDKYGYEIIKEINEKSNGTYELKQPTLYSCLKRLENQGLISAYWKNSDIGGKRHYYKLTKKGRENYENNINEWFSSRSIIDNLMGSKRIETIESTSPSIQPQEDEESVIENTQENIIESETNSENFDDNKEENLDEETDEEKLFETSPSTQLHFSGFPPENDDYGDIDFENKSIDEEDSKLLEGYYQTDENQINFLENLDNSFSEENEMTSIESESLTDAEKSDYGYGITIEFDHNSMDDELYDDSEDKEDDNVFPTYENETQERVIQKEDLDAFFHKYEGTDVNKYRNRSQSAYYDKITDDNDAKIIEDETKDDDLIGAESNSFTFVNYDGDDDNSTNLKLFDEEDDEESSYNYDSPEFDNDFEYSKPQDNYTSSRLNFGSGYEEDPDELNMPVSFGGIEKNADLDEDEASEEFNEENVADYASRFGRDYADDSDDDFKEQDEYEEQVEEKSNNLELFDEEETSFIPYPKLSNTMSVTSRPAYTELEHKDKLNNLSSYTQAPTIELNFVPEATENKDYAKLKEDFEDAGILVRTYSKKVKEPQSAKNYLLVNKIKFVTSWINYFIVLILLSLTYLLASKVNYTDLSLIPNSYSAISYFAIAAGCMLALPGFYTTLFLFNKTKKVKPNYSAVISLIFALLFFVVCINIIYLINILLGFTGFSQPDFNHLYWLIPSVCALSIVIQSVVYTLLFKTKEFNA